MSKVKEKTRRQKVKSLDPSELPELPVGWSWVTLNDLAAQEPNSIIDGPFGSNLKTSHYTNEGPRVLRLQNIGDGEFIDAMAHISDEHFESLAKHHIFGGDVIIAALGETLPRSCVVPYWVGPALVKADCPRFKPNPELTTSSYVSFALNSPDTRKRTSNIIHGVGRPRLNLAEMRGTWIPFAPPNEQKRIVAKIEELFSDLDAGVSALERARANLRRYRASVLKSAVEGRLTAKWRSANPGVEPASVLISRTESPPRPNRYNTRNKDVIPGHAALSVGKTDGALPNGWAWAPLVEVARMESGHTPSRKREDWWGGDIPWLGITDAREHNGRIIHDTLQKTNEKGIANSAARLLPIGTVCISRTASVGYVTVMGTEMATSQDFVNWVPTEAVSADWLRIVFSTDREALQRFGKGSVHKTIYFPEWLSVHIAVPPIEEQRVITSFVDEQISSIEFSEAAVDRGLMRAHRLGQSILKAAFEGALVSQYKKDEPTSVLIERIRAERESAEKLVKPKVIRTKGPKMTRKKRRPILEALEEQKETITPERLMSLTGFEAESVDDFYAELKLLRKRLVEEKPSESRQGKWPNDEAVTLALKEK